MKMWPQLDFHISSFAGLCVSLTRIVAVQRSRVFFVWCQRTSPNIIPSIYFVAAASCLFLAAVFFRLFRGFGCGRGCRWGCRSWVMCLSCSSQNAHWFVTVSDREDYASSSSCGALFMTTHSHVTIAFPSVLLVTARSLTYQFFDVRWVPLKLVVVTTSPCTDTCFHSLLLRILFNGIVFKAVFFVSKLFLQVSFLWVHIWLEPNVLVINGVLVSGGQAEKSVSISFSSNCRKACVIGLVGQFVCSRSSSVASSLNTFL